MVLKYAEIFSVLLCKKIGIGGFLDLIFDPNYTRYLSYDYSLRLWIYAYIIWSTRNIEPSVSVVSLKTFVHEV